MKSTPISQAERNDIEALFKQHINAGQVAYVKAGHLDVIETDRQGGGFVDGASGRWMFDAFTAAGTFNVSRRNPAIVAALEEALDDGLDMGSFVFASEAKRALAKRLAAFAPADLNNVLFAAGGGDAVDCAIKLARGATGRTRILSTVKAYHGHTGFALSANGKAHYRHYCEPLMPNFEFAPFNDFGAIMRQASSDTAAILIEPVQGEAGIFPAREEYLRGLRTLCDERGILLIFDEIQTGFGRTGKRFACEHAGVFPDIMTVSKSFSGGLYPNAAVLYRPLPALVEFIEQNPRFHISYSGGSDLGCRVSLRVLEYIEEHRLWENAARMGARLTDALMELQRAQPQVIQDVRGLGLMLGIEYCHEFLGPMMSDALAKHGVFAAYSGNAPQVMRFMVPTTVNAEEMDRIIVAIRDAIADMKRVLPIALLAAKVPPVLKLLNNEHVQIAVFGLLRRIEDLTTKRADAADAPPASAEAALPVAPSEPQPVPEAAEVALPVQKAYAGILGVDLILTRQEGAYVYDQHGERYIDAITAAGTHNLGHRPEELVAELRAAANATDIGNFPMISREKARLGKALSEFVGHGLECAVFSVVRGEAIEAACKIARGFTGRSKLVTVDGGWYGQTGFAMSLSERADKDNYGPLIPDVRVLPFGDADAARAAIGGDTAAVVLELAQAENGCREADAAYARALADICRQHGAVLIVDETQTGFGRTGAKFLFETLAIEPDMLVLGEALGAGLYPIAVTLLTQRVNTFMNAHPLIHLSTFGGSDIGCRVAKRAVELYAQRAPWANAAAMGEKLLRELNALTHQDGCPIRAVHGRGLLIALDLGSAEQAVAFCRALAKEHLLTLPGEVATHTVVLRPSLLISEEETDAMLAAITAAARQIT